MGDKECLDLGGNCDMHAVMCSFQQGDKSLSMRDWYNPIHFFRIFFNCQCATLDTVAVVGGWVYIVTFGFL